MRHHFRHPQAMFNKGSLFYSHCEVAIMCPQAIRCNIHEFCCNGLQGVTLSYMALHDHLVSVTAIFLLPHTHPLPMYSMKKNRGSICPQQA
jgi:hypothetical protein